MRRLAKTYSPEQDTGWILAATNKIEELKNSIGFTAAWDSNRQQFDYDTMLAGINSDGTIKKKLFCIKDGNATMLSCSNLCQVILPAIWLHNDK